MKKMIKILSLILVLILSNTNFIYANESTYPVIPWDYIDGVNRLGEIIYEQGKYITAGYDGIKYSVDLEKWETVVIVDDSQYIYGGWPSITYNGKIFIVAGLSGRIYFSYDGIKWDYYEKPFDFDISEMIWDGKQFVAVGQFGREAFSETLRPAGIIVSSDGLNWTKLDVTFDIPWGLEHIAYNGSIYVADDITDIYYSYDLINWEKCNVYNGYNEGIEWVKDRFIATRGFENIMYSYNGIDWSNIDQSWGNTMWACAYNGNIFVSVGADGTIYVSYDGLNWICKTEWHRVDNALYDIIWTGERFVVLGNKNNLTWVPNDIIKVKVNNEYLIMDTAPITINDRTLLPVRAISESLNADVKWDDGTRTASVTKGDINLLITEGKSIVTVNGEEIVLDTIPVLYEGRFMLPVRFISETLNFVVDWDEESKTVIINS